MPAPVLSALARYGRVTAGRLKSLFEEDILDGAALGRTLTEILGEPVNDEELEHYVLAVQASWEKVLAEAAGDAGRTARVDPVIRTLMAQRFLAKGCESQPSAAAVVAAAVTPGTGKRWRTSRVARREQTTDEAERASAERLEHQKWSLALVSILLEAEAPVTVDAAGNQREQSVLLHLFREEKGVHAASQSALLPWMATLVALPFWDAGTRIC